MDAGVALIAYLCTAPRHMRTNGPAASSDHLTIVEREWAFCPGDARSDSHRWEATGGVTLGEIQSRLRTLRGAAEK